MLIISEVVLVNRLVHVRLVFGRLGILRRAASFAAAEVKRNAGAERVVTSRRYFYFTFFALLSCYYIIYHSIRSRTETLPSRLVRVLVHTQLQPHTSLSTPRTTGTANTQKHQNTRWLDQRLDIFYRHITTSHHAPFLRPSLRRLSCTTPSGTATHPLDPTRPRPVTFPTHQLHGTGRTQTEYIRSLLSLAEVHP